ncbi:MAG TPA: hypothetical protein PKJ93_10015, partial [Methanoculleus sp.]|nr:hypothetical protein [Methanoculleus sp.]
DRRPDIVDGPPILKVSRISAIAILPGEYPLPRRIAMAEIRDTFQDGWSIDYVRPAVFENTVQADGHLAWLASISRKAQE